MKLFWRIFLSFWLATVLMIAVVVGAREIWQGDLPGERQRKFRPQTAEYLLTKAADAYESRDYQGLSSGIQSIATSRHISIFLFDASGKFLSGSGTPDLFYHQAAKEVLQSGQGEFEHVGFRALYVCPVQSSTGGRYAAVLVLFQPTDRLFSFRFWFNVAIAVVPAALVCLLLTLYLIRPITRLRATARLLASGDLSARAAPLCRKRGDELGDLAFDFDMMAAQIQVLMTAQRRFVADVSHELGAPLTRMHLALALLRRQFAGRNVSELERIERETDKLSNLVQQLLLLAGLEAGRCPAESLAPVSIKTLCESIVDDANFEAAHADCQVVGAREELTVLAYPGLLRRAIDNVLRNAIHYTHPGTEVLLEYRVDHERQQILLEVLDCGPGIPESMLTDIFRPFFRTSPGRESNSGGTGLGLSIAAEAVRLHEGTITAENRQNGGLKVTITLPLRIPVTERELQASVTEV